MSQKQIERPQEKKPRPAEQEPEIGGMDIGDTDDLLKDLDVIEHPEKYSQEQRDCSCFDPPKSKGGFR